jgi:hypothetical protein
MNGWSFKVSTYFHTKGYYLFKQVLLFDQLTPINP